MPNKASSSDKPTTPDVQPDTSNDAAVQAIDIKVNPGASAAKADVTVEHIVEDPQADVLAWDPPAIGIGDPTVPRADSHDPRPAN
jgi:hypothetical protein